MIRAHVIFSGCLVVVTTAFCHAQTILHNAKVYTVDASNPWAHAIAINADGTIAAVGNFSDIRDSFPKYELSDIKGQLVLPGFHDVHVHAVEAGINRALCFVSEDVPIEDIPLWFDDCEDYGEFGGQGWVMGAGVNLELIVSELESDFSVRYPITVLDESWPNTPVVILDQYGHGALANTKAMAAVGYLTGQDPPGGQILRDSNGDLLGIVLENAQQKLREAAFPPTDENIAFAYKSLKQAMKELNAHGITTVSDAGGFWRQAQTDAWGTALDDGILTVRASNALYVYPDEDVSYQLKQLQAKFSNDPHSLLRFNQAKIYVDGILSLSNGKLYDPYGYDPFKFYRSGQGSWSGFEYFDRSMIRFYSKILVDRGFQLHFHVTGDLGARIALETIGMVQDSTNASTISHRVTHCYLVEELDQNLFAEIGVFADMQIAPSSMSDAYNTNMRGLLGTSRADSLLPAMELHEAGAMMTLSSDWDADTLSPLLKLQTVLTRRYGRSFPDLETVIPMMTLNGAKLLQHDDKTGSIAVGKFADLVVIDKDIFALPYNQIASAKVNRTYLQGQLVYQRGEESQVSEDEWIPTDNSFSVSMNMSTILRAVGIILALYIFVR